jgi:hypothetical protein
VRELREEVLIAAETSSVLTERLFRTMNLMDPPADYNPLLDDRCNAMYGKPTERTRRLLRNLRIIVDVLNRVRG